MNISAYTGLAYDFRRRNCWHHVRNVRKDAGIETPAFDVLSPVGINSAFSDAHDDPKGLVQVEFPSNYDAVLMGIKSADRIVWHAGVYFDGMVSHCDRLSRQVRLELLTDLKQQYAEIEFWR